MSKYYINERHITCLVNEIPALNNQPEIVKFWLTYLVFSIASGMGVKHIYDNTKNFISYNLIRKCFPKNTGDFMRLNEQIGLFEFSQNWYSSKGHGRTCVITDKAKQIVQKYHSQQLEKPVIVSFIDEQGKQIRKPRAAIGRKDSNGKDRASTGQLDSATIKIDVGNVYQLLNEVSRDMQQPDNDSRFYRGLKLNKSERTGRLFQYGQQGIACIENASLPNLQPGEMIHTYHEAASGRLVGNGFHLQNVRREIREAALPGHWDYDISNCHYSFA